MNKDNKSANEDGPIFKTVEVVLIPLAWAVRFQVALIRQTLYVAFISDRLVRNAIAKLKRDIPRISFKNDE